MLGRISTFTLRRSATPFRPIRLCSSTSCSPLLSKKMATSTSKSTKVTQDSWKLPVSTSPVPELKVYNSLTRTKVSFDSLLSLNMTQLISFKFTRNRSSSSRRNLESSHGTTVVQPSTMHPIWDMRGKDSSLVIRLPQMS